MAASDQLSLRWLTAPVDATPGLGAEQHSCRDEVLMALELNSAQEPR